MPKISKMIRVGEENYLGVADLHHVDADVDSDPDPASHFNADADPDPDPTFHF